MRNRLCILARLRGGGADQGGDPPPGTISPPLSSSARERPIPPLPLCDLLGWQCQAGRGLGEVLGWAEGGRAGLGDRGGLQLSL